MVGVMRLTSDCCAKFISAFRKKIHMLRITFRVMLRTMAVPGQLLPQKTFQRRRNAAGRINAIALALALENNAVGFLDRRLPRRLARSLVLDRRAAYDFLCKRVAVIEPGRAHSLVIYSRAMLMRF
jgi:hypothetical protein